MEGLRVTDASSREMRSPLRESRQPGASVPGPLQLKHSLGRAPLAKDRQDWILEQAAGKRVLHVGCADVGFFQQNLERGRLLHARLETVCAEVLGVDIDEPGIARMRALGLETTICCDVSTETERLMSEIRKTMGGCDIILCGEVLEHLLNYDQFLRGIRTLAGEFDSIVLITVPNTFNIEGFFHLLLGAEYVHPDHKCYFSEVTLRTLLQQTGFEVVDIGYYTNDMAKSTLTRLAKDVLRNTLLAFRPQLAEGVIARAVPARGEASGGGASKNGAG